MVRMLPDVEYSRSLYDLECVGFRACCLNYLWVVFQGVDKKADAFRINRLVLNQGKQVSKLLFVKSHKYLRFKYRRSKRR
jgi:hypothetical protein